MTKKILYIVFLLLGTVGITTAQPTFTTSSQEVENGDIINVEVKVSNFIDIVGMQYSLNWDTDALEFMTIHSFNLVDLTSEEFGTTEVGEGKLRMLWSSPDAVYGTSIDDNTTIYMVRFRFVGSEGDGSRVSFSDDPIIAEVIAAGGVVYYLDDLNLENGTIATASYVSATEIQSNKGITLFQNKPNPFGSFTLIPFTLDNSNDIQFTINDITGKLIYNYNAFYQEGTHTLRIDKSIIPAAGVYTYTLQTAGIALVNKMIFIQ